MKYIYSRLVALADWLFPFFLLTVRVYIARVFFRSGLTKVADWENALNLFQFEYKVPYIDYHIAAYSGTFFELVMPVMLVAGFATRLAALPLLAMTAVIQFTYDQNVEHVGWAVMLTLLVLKGAGKFSLDELIYRKFGR